MTAKTVTKVDSQESLIGKMGQKYLAAGKNVAMRLWENEQPNESKPPSTKEYETVGYVVKGRAELHIEGQMILIEAGDSYFVPQGASHTYKILEPFTAVEATSPPDNETERD